jgi:hypothetical protein
MDEPRFEQSLKAFAGVSRRGITRVLGGFSLTGILARLLGLADTDAKKEKRKHKKNCKKCGPCKACKKGKCRPKPAGTPCGNGKQCFASGACVACDVCFPGCTFNSLQDAVDAAEEGATIQLCPGTFSTSAYIDKSVTVIGAGSGARGTVLDGHGLDRVILFEKAGPAIELEMRGLTITGGASDIGAGIYSSQIVTLDDVHLTDNHATSRAGAIYSFVATTLIDSHVTENSAPIGGGIYNNGSLRLTAGSSVTENTANGGGGNDGQSAGGIHNVAGGTVELSDGSSVTGNIPFDCSGTPAC